MGFKSGISDIEVRDEGVAQGRVTALDFVGADVTAVVAGDVATITVTATGGMTSTEIFLDFGTREVSF